MSPRVVAITGASAGIGRATAIAFARRGWRVALIARGRAGLEGARRDVAAAGGTALVVPADVADAAQVEAAAARIEDAWQGIDVWINNAMATVFSEFASVTPEDFRRATDVTYLGTVWGTRAALRRMQPRNRGVIVQVGSALAYRSIPLQAAYCGAKSAVRGYTDALRCELLHQRSGVHLTSVHLAAFNTPQFDWARTGLPHAPRPMGKVFQPAVAAEAIYWAAHQRRREVWVGSPAVQAILGQRLVPGLLDRLLARRGYAGQQSRQPITGARADTLYHPAAADHGVRGRFDAEAHGTSLQMTLNRHRGVALLAGGCALLALLRWRAHRAVRRGRGTIC